MRDWYTVRSHSLPGHRHPAQLLITSCYVTARTRLLRLYTKPTLETLSSCTHHRRHLWFRTGSIAGVFPQRVYLGGISVRQQLSLSSPVKTPQKFEELWKRPNFQRLRTGPIGFARDTSLSNTAFGMTRCASPAN